MFRQEEVFFDNWNEMTIDAMQKRRFKQMVSRLAPLGISKLETLNQKALDARIEQSWQNIPRKPMHRQQMDEVWKSVIGSIEIQADSLSAEEHCLAERALILGGSARIEDIQELEAAWALSMRLWGCVGLVSEKPYLELEAPVMAHIARAFARSEHEKIRQKLELFGMQLTAQLYQAGAVDDRGPQRIIGSEILCGEDHEVRMQLARRYLWAGWDCVDHAGRVFLVHSALACPRRLLKSCRARQERITLDCSTITMGTANILPEEIPLQNMLERVITGALRDGLHAQDVTRNIRFLCKQGAPLRVMESVLQDALIVCLSSSMRQALRDMYYQIPKWMESDELYAFQ